MTRITFEGRRYPLQPEETVLEALLRGGATVTFSCRRGTCQSCLLRAESGDPGSASTENLRPSLAEAGYFLPCKAVPTEDLSICRPDPSRLAVRVHVHQKELVAPGIARISVEPETNFDWRAGQYLNVRHPSGESRSYSIASVAAEDYFIEIHVRAHERGFVSRWLVDTISEGDVIEIDGPHGACCYEPADYDAPLLLLGTGTGLAPLVGVARTALARGHSAPIFLYHGVSEARSLYLDARLREMAAANSNFHYCASVSREVALPPHVVQGRAADIAFERHRDLSRFGVFLAGNPDMVYAARSRAFSAGADRERIKSDPFERREPFMPDDGAKLANLAPDPELWAALSNGVLLRRILTDFYARVYADERLAPYFHKVTIERAIDKQYAFLADVITGERAYFGLKPFNAHHWMIISDELFDYRERLLESCMARHGLEPRFIRRWSAIHELFRREIVKATPRGMIVDGVEHLHSGFREELLELGCLCDGCDGEMVAGSVGRLHARTGELFCVGCSARRVGATLPPLALDVTPAT